MKSSRLPPSAHCISTLLGGDNVSNLRRGKGRKGTCCSVGTFGPKEENWAVSSHAWLVWRVRFIREEKRAYLLVCNDVGVM